MEHLIEQSAAAPPDEDLGLLDWLEKPEVVWLEEGQVCYETNAVYVGTGTPVLFECRVPAPAAGFYLTPFCDPGCCDPTGPFATRQDAVAFSREKAAAQRAEMAKLRSPGLQSSAPDSSF
jgi:hypothetical protein